MGASSSTNWLFLLILPRKGTTYLMNIYAKNMHPNITATIMTMPIPMILALSLVILKISIGIYWTGAKNLYVYLFPDGVCKVITRSMDIYSYSGLPFNSLSSYCFEIYKIVCSFLLFPLSIRQYTVFWPIYIHWALVRIGSIPPMTRIRYWASSN